MQQNIKLKDGDEFSILANGKNYKCFTNGAYTDIYDQNGKFNSCQNNRLVEANLNANEEIYCWKLTSTIANKYEREAHVNNKLSITQDIYFDVAKHAKMWNVKHEEASKRIQEVLFESGIYWLSGHKDVKNYPQQFLVVEQDVDGGSWHIARPLYKPAPKFQEATLQANTTYTLQIQEKEELVEEDVIQLLGKKYSKKDLEEALKLLSPKEE